MNLGTASNGLYLGQVTALPVSGTVLYKGYSSGALTVQNTTPILLSDIVTIDGLTIGQKVLITSYFELFADGSDFQTYSLLVDGTPVLPWTASMSAPNNRTSYTWTWQYIATATSHTFQVQGSSTSGLQTDTNDSFSLLVQAVTP